MLPPQLGLCHSSREVPESRRPARPPLARSPPSATSLSSQGDQTPRAVFRMLTSSLLQPVLLHLQIFEDPTCCQQGPQRGLALR